MGKLFCYGLFGLFDLYSVITYLYYKISYGHIPFYTDFLRLQILYPQHQSAVYFSIVLFTALYISLFFSIYGFFFQRKWIVQLILWQLPLRLIWVVPSYPTMEILYELLWLNRSISFGEISFIVWGALLVFELFKIFLLCSFKSNR